MASEGPRKVLGLGLRDKGLAHSERRLWGRVDAVVGCLNGPVKWEPRTCCSLTSSKCSPVSPERWKDPVPTQGLPEAELEDSLELQHGLQGPFTTAGLVGPGWLGQKQLPSEPAPQIPTDQVLGWRVCLCVSAQGWAGLVLKASATAWYYPAGLKASVRPPGYPNPNLGYNGPTRMTMTIGEA